MFRRRRYELPKFPPHVIPSFRRLCAAKDSADVPEIKIRLEAAVHELKMEAQSKGLLDQHIIEALYNSATFLLEHYEEFNKKQQALLIGAVYYFGLSDDPSPDTSFATGLDDDVAVMNYVLEELGVEGFFISLPNS